MRAAAAIVWKQEDGTPVACREKLEILNENHAELCHVMQDAFDDAILMGVEEAFLRTLFAGLAAGLKTPKA
jgi:hypothetical protein